MPVRSFENNQNDILKGTFSGTLIDEATDQSHNLREVNRISVEKIYDHHSVIQVEVASYKVLSEILDIYLKAALNPAKSALERKTMQLLPGQFGNQASPYETALQHCRLRSWVWPMAMPWKCTATLWASK